MLDNKQEQINRDKQIYQLSTLVAGNFSLPEVLDRLAEAAVKITGVKACSIRLLDEQGGDLEMRSTYGLSESYRNKGVVSKEDIVIKIAFEGQAVIIDDMRVDDRIRYKEATAKEGLVSQLTVAMTFRGNNIGVLRLYSPRPKRFSHDNIALARAVASQCAVAITNAKLYGQAIEGSRIAEQMRLAGIIQRRMIPARAPAVKGLEIAANYTPCFDVGGDLYDFIELGDNRFVVMIADVMGKGVPAALMMSLFRGTARAYADIACGSGDIKQIIEKLNLVACQQCRDGEFISLFYAIIDAENMTVDYCNCGHEPALLFRDGKYVDLNKGGLVLGVEENTDYEVGKLELQTEDCLLFYTDGLIDASNFEGEFWGLERMVEAASQFRQCAAGQMVKNILAYRRRFVGLAKQIDDTSIIVIKTEQSTRCRCPEVVD
jgi:sigma-B regulation protein RsbU (phosphoserine phosphatase)